MKDFSSIPGVDDSVKGLTAVVGNQSQTAAATSDLTIAERVQAISARLQSKAAVARGNGAIAADALREQTGYTPTISPTLRAAATPKVETSPVKGQSL